MATDQVLGQSGLHGAKFRFLTRVLPLRHVDIALVDKMEILISEVATSRIAVHRLDCPTVSSNLAPSHPGLLMPETRLEATAVHDLSAWFGCISLPNIECFDLGFARLSVHGKNYGSKAVQETLVQGDETCIHGSKKRWCSYCIEREKQDTQGRARLKIDLFDMILPILQPPLGDDFDSPIAFAQGQELKPFQRLGVKFLVENKAALLGDEMGLGKSIQTIVAMRFLVRMGHLRKGLLLCPKSVLIDWETKLWEWAPELRVQKVRGAKQERELQWI